MKILAILIGIYLVLVVLNPAPEPAKEGITAREIDSSCDIVLFTTQTCGYCKKAKKILAKKDVQWCEKDIGLSEQNRQVFVSLGGRGVPVMVAGDKILHGYSEQAYIAAIDNVSQ